MSTETQASSGTAPIQADGVAVLGDISAMLRALLDEYGLDDAEITRETTFHGDLELESIDLVGLSGSLRARYGERVNFAAFIAELDLDEIIDLRVGQLVDYVVDSLRTAEGAADHGQDPRG